MPRVYGALPGAPSWLWLSKPAKDWSLYSGSTLIPESVWRGEGVSAIATGYEIWATWTHG